MRANPDRQARLAAERLIKGGFPLTDEQRQAVVECLYGIVKSNAENRDKTRASGVLIAAERTNLEKAKLHIELGSEEAASTGEITHEEALYLNEVLLRARVDYARSRSGRIVPDAIEHTSGDRGESPDEP